MADSIHVIATVAPQAVSVTTTGGVPGPKGDPGDAADLIDDAATGAGRTWSAAKIQAELDALEALTPSLANYYTKTETDGLLSSKADAADLAQRLTQAQGDARYSPLGHAHAGQYDPAGTASGTVSAHLAAAPHLSAAQAGVAAPVQSVAGKTGAVTLGVADTAGLQAALDGKAATAHAHAGLIPPGGSAGQVLAKTGAADNEVGWVAPPGASGRFQRGATFVSGSGPVVPPALSVPLVMPVDCVITAAVITTQGGAGACQFDIARAGVSLCAGAPPTVSAGVGSIDTALVGWTVVLAAFDQITVTLNSSSVFTLVDLTLVLEAT